MLALGDMPIAYSVDKLTSLNPLWGRWLATMLQKSEKYWVDLVLNKANI